MAIAHQITDISLTNEHLNDLKCRWTKEINSIRSLGRVRSIVDLVNVLWKRDELRLQNINRLFTESSGIFNENEIKIIQNYVEMLAASFDDFPTETSDEFVTEIEPPQNNTVESEPKKPAKHSNYSPHIEKYYQHEPDILNLISEMGIRKFMDFARQKEMRISPAELENVSIRFRDVPSQIHHLLGLAAERNERHEFPDILLDCLRKAGRMDLKRKIEQQYLSQ